MVLDDFDDQMIAGDECRRNFLTLVMQLRKKPQPGNLPDRGSNPGLLGARQQRYPWITAVVSILFVI